MSDKKKILVVDDEPDMVEWMTTFFEDHGFDTISASDGMEGMAKAEADQPDLITLDITMDKESGVKMFRNLQGSEKTSKIPVIIVTGMASEFRKFIETRKQVDPPDAYFEKPVDRDALLAKVKELTA
jgi:DNA-binding response OmpR family regulator